MKCLGLLTFICCKDGHIYLPLLVFKGKNSTRGGLMQMEAQDTGLCGHVARVSLISGEHCKKAPPPWPLGL